MYIWYKYAHVIIILIFLGENEQHIALIGMSVCVLDELVREIKNFVKLQENTILGKNNTTSRNITRISTVLKSNKLLNTLCLLKNKDAKKKKMFTFSLHRGHHRLTSCQRGGGGLDPHEQNC